MAIFKGYDVAWDPRNYKVIAETDGENPAINGDDIALMKDVENMFCHTFGFTTPPSQSAYEFINGQLYVIVDGETISVFEEDDYTVRDGHWVRTYGSST